MSEAIPGLPPAPKPGKARDAASVVMFRRGPQGIELFWLKRERNLAFAGGYYAFPGGSVDAEDAQISVHGAEGQDAALRVAAARELFEETGVLIAAGAEHLTVDQRASVRQRLLGQSASFKQVTQDLGLVFRSDQFRPAGRWITPPFLPKRFDARFYVAEVPADTAAEIWPGESSEGAWILPSAALKRWEEGTALLHPPALHVLQAFARFTDVNALVNELQTPPNTVGFVPSRIEFQRGIRMFPLETPTLPPATHTNCYLLGNGELLVVDPGASEGRQVALLLALIAGLKAEGKRPVAVLLTHHHQDHIGGAQAVCERLSVPLWCHERTADRLPFPADRILKDGEAVTLNGVPAMRFQALHTPGHARGHLCLIDELSRAAIVGDMVAGLGTIVIDPPEGDMTDYMSQLARLRDLPVTTLYPAHGPAVPDGPAKLAEYIRHREMRERRVLDAVSATGNTLLEIVPQAYSDVDPAIFPIAERSAQAVLIKLVRENRVARREERYFKL